MSTLSWEKFPEKWRDYFEAKLEEVGNLAGRVFVVTVDGTIVDSTESLSDFYIEYGKPGRALVVTKVYIDKEGQERADFVHVLGSLYQGTPN